MSKELESDVKEYIIKYTPRNKDCFCKDIKHSQNIKGCSKVVVELINTVKYIDEIIKKETPNPIK